MSTSTVAADRATQQSSWTLAPTATWTALLLLVGAALPLAFASSERLARSALERVLRAATGLPVTVGQIGLTLEPALTLDRLRIASLASIDRVEIAATLDGLRRPRLGRIRLVRPDLRLGLLSNWASRGQQRPSQHSASAQRQRRRRRLPPVAVQDGRVRFQIIASGQRLSVDARGIYFDALGEQRLVVGPTRVSLGKRMQLSMSAAAVDLASDAPPRAAALGGVLLPGDGGGAIALQRLQIHRHDDGFRLELQGRPISRGGGTINARASFTAAGVPRSAELLLREVDLEPLAPLLTRHGLMLHDAHLSGTIVISRHPQRQLTARVDLAATGLRAEHPWLAARDVGPMPLSVAGLLRFDDANRRIVIEAVELRSSGLRATVEGEIQRGSSGSRVALTARMPRTSCQTLLSSLPRGFAPKLEGMALAGELGIEARLSVDSAALAQSDLAVDFAPLDCKVLVDPVGADVRTLRRPLTVHVPGSDGQPRRWRLGPSNPHYRRLAQISPHVRAAFVAAEDTNFFHHRGFDAGQIRRAFAENLRVRSPVRGASTISQQLVKNVFLDHRRTAARKFQEMVLTWRLEQLISKRRILELYLNLVEMGPGIHGVEQASRHYFDAPAAHATPLQAAHLAALTPSPRPLAERFARAAPGPAWIERLQMILRLMRRGGYLPREEQQRWARATLTLATTPR